MSNAESPSPAEWAGLLRENWELRAQSPSRDFYVASHPGWDDPDVWADQAGVDATLFLHGLDEAWLHGAQVLDVGCGVGRLARTLHAKCATYTGVDISESMVAEARRRHGDLAGVRFIVGDGLTLPPAACDQTYDFIISLAVFIHCPADVVASIVKSAYQQLAPGGEFRFQLRADPNDHEGVTAAPSVDAQAASAEAMESAATPADMSLIEGHYYMGHEFTYSEAQALLGQIEGADATVVRFDYAHIYGIVKRPMSGA